MCPSISAIGEDKKSLSHSWVGHRVPHLPFAESNRTLVPFCAGEKRIHTMLCDVAFSEDNCFFLPYQLGLHVLNVSSLIVTSIIQGRSFNLEIECTLRSVWPWSSPHHLVFRRWMPLHPSGLERDVGSSKGSHWPYCTDAWGKCGWQRGPITTVAFFPVFAVCKLLASPLSLSALLLLWTLHAWTLYHVLGCMRISLLVMHFIAFCEA